MKLHITKGNMKLPKETLNFSLPPEESCPGATKECKKHCYAKKAYRIYPSTRVAWKENYKLSHHENFVVWMIFELYEFRNWKQFRIHTSGDFYSQEYLEKWFRIARQFPQKIFYAYTKSLLLDFSNKPKNFIVIASVDKQIKGIERRANRLKKLGFDGIASVVDKDYKRQGTEVICPADCRKCSYCFVKTDKLKEIKFKKH